MEASGLASRPSPDIRPHNTEVTLIELKECLRRCFFGAYRMRQAGQGRAELGVCSGREHMTRLAMVMDGRGTSQWGTQSALERDGRTVRPRQRNPASRRDDGLGAPNAARYQFASSALDGQVVWRRYLHRPRSLVRNGALPGVGPDSQPAQSNLSERRCEQGGDTFVGSACGCSPFGC